MWVMKAMNRPIARLFYTGMATFLLLTHVAWSQEKPKQEIGGPWWESMKQVQGMVFGDLSTRHDLPTEEDMKAAELSDVLTGNAVKIKDQNNPSKNSKKTTRVFDPNSANISALIRQWIKIAEPPSNARGARLKYEKWGRVYGQAINHTVKINAKPDDVNGRTPEQYVWDMRNFLDSVNHCSLGEYVTLKNEGQSLDHCMGRYKTKVSDVAGLSKTQAEKKLASLGLKTKVKLGRPAPTKNKSLTVERTLPDSGTAIMRGGIVTLVLHTPFKDTKIVPLSPGDSAKEAMKKIKRAGLKPKIAVVKATRPGQTGEIQSLDPPEGTELKAGAVVLVNIFGPYVKTVPVPDVTGLTKEKAFRKLASVGLKARLSSQRETDDSHRVGTIYSQRPAVGTQVKAGENIELVVYKLSKRGWATRQAETRRSEEALAAVLNQARKKREAQRQKERQNATAPPMDHTGTEFILDSVVIRKPQDPKDLCRQDKNCYRFKSANGYYAQDYYLTFAKGKAVLDLKKTIISTGQPYSDMVVTFLFDSPPAKIYSGNSLHLKVRATAKGFVKGGIHDRNFKYSIQHDGGYERPLNNGYVKMGNGQLPNDGNLFQGEASKETMTEVPISKNVKKEIIITGKFGPSPVFNISWIYKISDQQHQREEARRLKEIYRAALAEQQQNTGKGVTNIRIPTYLTGLPLTKISAGNKTTEYSGTKGNPSQLTALLTRSKRNNEFMYTGFNPKRMVSGEYSTQNNTSIVPTITLEWLDPSDKNRRDYTGNLNVRIGCLGGKEKGKILSSQKNNIFYLDSPRAVARVSVVFWYKERVTQKAISEVNNILPELMAQIEPYAKKCAAR